MHIRFRGKKGIVSLPLKNSQNMHRVAAPTSNTRIIVSAVITVILIVVLSYLKKQFWGLSLHPIYAILGIVFAVAVLPVHEIIHGVCYGKGRDVFILWSGFILMTFSDKPVSRRRYLIILSAPVFILGIVPMLFWLFISPKYVVMQSILFGFSFTSIGLSLGDIIALFGVIKNVPDDATIMSDKDGLSYSITN